MVTDIDESFLLRYSSDDAKYGKSKKYFRIK